MSRLSHLNALQALEATLRHGSMRRAADELRITAAALGQRIKTLEDYLGYTLLQRSPEGIVATPPTEEVRATLQNAFSQLSEVARGLQFDRPNTITLQADAQWYECWLLPRIERMSTLHPDIVVEEFRPRGGNQKPDLSISLCSPTSNQIKLFEDYLVPIVTPKIRQRFHRENNVDVLEDQPLLHLDTYTQHGNNLDWPHWFETHGFRKRGHSRGIRYNSVKNALDAIGNNAGAVLVGVALCLHRIKTGEVCLLVSAAHGTWSEFAYCIEQPDRPRKQVENFIHWLQAEASQTRSDIQTIIQG